MFALPRSIKGVKVYPGLKDLPAHLRQNFRNEFIRYVIKCVANLQSPWANPSIESIQVSYQLVYPLFPAQVRNNDAVHHPVSDYPPLTLRDPDTS